MRLKHLHTYIWCFRTFKGVLLFFCCVVHTCKNSILLIHSLKKSQLTAQMMQTMKMKRYVHVRVSLTPGLLLPKERSGTHFLRMREISQNFWRIRILIIH